ncbi:site-specific DNA-methyltransferase [Streptomyces sp. SID1328]|nr:site-specific DNA-methyltransferase [Streptomyces sp. SID1328]
MQQVQQGDPETESKDLVAANVDQLKSLFPDAFTEGRIDFDVLMQLLGENIDEGKERYGLNWHGKRQARRIALTPSTGTLLPRPEESVDWDTTQNLVIEGDNLEALKLLQKSYAGQVKLIYIDPPYNTGNDFIYADRFNNGVANYLEITGQLASDGSYTSSARETSGGAHSAWLSMMMPRLQLARNLLHDEGAIFVSCDDIEVANLRQVLDELYGPENFIAQFVWKARKFTDARAVTNISTDHEYIVAYSKQAGFTAHGIERDESKFSNPDSDPRGPWMSRSLLGLANKEQRPNLHYDIVEPGTGRRFPPNPETGWRYAPERMRDLIEAGSIIFPKKDDGRPREKKFRADMKSDFIAFRSIIDDVHTSNGTDELKELLGEGVFPFPKPVELIRRIVEQVTSPGDITLDFFAGSGTTGHAVAKQNSIDGGDRRFILIQLPEPLSTTNKAQRTAAQYCESINRPHSISEITKERLVRALGTVPAVTDRGFRVFALANSNINRWDTTRQDPEQQTIEVVDNIVDGRTEQDLLYELLLNLGLDLSSSIDTRTFDGVDVFSTGYGLLFACLPPGDAITKDNVEAIAHGIVDWRKELDPTGEVSVYFKDTAFRDDVAKANMAAILAQHGFPFVKSL